MEIVHILVDVVSIIAVIIGIVIFFVRSEYLIKNLIDLTRAVLVEQKEQSKTLNNIDKRLYRYRRESES